MRIALNAEQVENHPFGFRKLTYEPHDFRFRNTLHFFCRRLCRNPFQCTVQRDMVESARKSHMIYDKVYGDFRNPRLQSARRLISPYSIKYLYDAVVHEITRQFSVSDIPYAYSIEGTRIPCIQFLPGSFISVCAKYGQFYILYVS